MINTNKFKVMFSVNGLTVSTNILANTSETNKQVYLHDVDGSLLASYPIGDNFIGIDNIVKETCRMLGKINKLILTKDSHTIELSLHWSKEYNQHRITFCKPNSKYKPSTAYEDSLTDTLDTSAKVLHDLTNVNLDITKQLVSKLKLNVATARMNNNW